MIPGRNLVKREAETAKAGSPFEIPALSEVQPLHLPRPKSGIRRSPWQLDIVAALPTGNSRRLSFRIDLAPELVKPCLFRVILRLHGRLVSLFELIV